MTSSSLKKLRRRLRFLADLEQKSRLAPRDATKRQEFRTETYRTARVASRSDDARFFERALEASGTSVEAFLDALLQGLVADRRRRWDENSLLSYSARKQVPAARLYDFIAEKGGVKKCIRRMSRLRQKRIAMR